MSKASDIAPGSDFVRSFQRLVGAVFRLNGQLLRTADQITKDLDITPARWQVIAVVRYEPMTAAQIARRLGLSRQGVQQVLNRLSDQGLLEMKPNPDHQRSPLAVLTERGKAVMEVLRGRQAELTHQFTDHLGLAVADMDRLTEQLESMRSTAEHFGNNTPDWGKAPLSRLEE